MQTSAMNAASQPKPLFAYTSSNHVSHSRRRRTIAEFSQCTRRTPRLKEAGHFVVIGAPSARGKKARVWIGWCPFDQELELLESVRESTRKSDLMILAYEDATRGDVLRIREKFLGCQLWGNWYRRTELVMREVKRINDEHGEQE